MALKKKLDRFFAVIAKLCQKFCACLLLLMIGVVSLQVIARVLRITIPWTQEVATISLIWLTMIGSIAVLIKGEHLTVDLFLVRYKPGQRRVARIFIDAVPTVFCCILLVFGLRLCRSPIVVNGRTVALAISRVWVYLSLPVSMFFNTLYAAYRLIASVIDLATGGRLSAGEEAAK